MSTGGTATRIGVTGVTISSPVTGVSPTWLGLGVRPPSHVGDGLCRTASRPLSYGVSTPCRGVLGGFSAVGPTVRGRGLHSVGRIATDGGL